MTSTATTIHLYKAPDGQSPPEQWMNSLEKPALACVLRRLRRLEAGNLGSWRSLQGTKGLFELKEMRFGGLRIYLGQKGQDTLLLWGGTKSSQVKDIQRATLYWQEAQSRL